MNNFEIYVHEQIDLFAKKYEGSECADDLIGLKINITNWLQQRKRAIHDFYTFNKTDERISFVYNFKSFKARIVFYKNTNVRFVIDHSDHKEMMIINKDIINDYCLDVGSVYFIESEFGWKIGKAKLITRRRNEFGVQLPFKFALRYHVRTTNKSDLEKYCHNYFKDRQINGEWYLVTNDEIRKAIHEFPITPHLKLSGYPFDDNIFIERKYLEKITDTRIMSE
jgi:hypothetical protein